MDLRSGWGAPGIRRTIFDDPRQPSAPDRYRAMIEHGPAVSYIDATDEKASTIFVSPQILTGICSDLASARVGR